MGKVHHCNIVSVKIALILYELSVKIPVIIDYCHIMAVLLYLFM